MLVRVRVPPSHPALFQSSVIGNTPGFEPVETGGSSPPSGTKVFNNL